jgi:hypothetical protein
MEQRSATDYSAPENDLLIRRSRVRNPPGSFTSEQVPADSAGESAWTPWHESGFPVIAQGEEFVRRSCIIYGLVDPREPRRVRYVGKSVNPYGRFYTHLQTRYGPVGRWMAELHARTHDRYPDLVLLEHVARGASGRELFWFQDLRRHGQADLNGASPSAAGREFERTPLAKGYRAPKSESRAGVLAPRFVGGC